MKKSKQARAREFSPEAREYIKERDGGCIFCKMGYPIEGTAGQPGYQIMHYIPRSQGGLGIPENGAVGCLIHHQMLDNGKHGPEMKNLFRTYLQKHCSDWNEKKLVYSKWDF